MNSTTFAGLIATLLLCPMKAQAQDDKVYKALDQEVTINVNGNFKAFVNVLRDTLNVNIVVDPRVQEEIDPDVSRNLALKTVKGSTALRWVVRLFGLEYTIQNGVLLIGRKAWVQAPILRLYDVRSLVLRRDDHPGPVIEMFNRAESPGVQLFLEEEGEQSIQPDTLIELIRENIAPESWEGDAYSIEVIQSGRLMVTHFPRVHQEIEKFLKAWGSMKVPVITLTAQIVEASPETAALLNPTGVTVYPPEKVEAINKKLTAGKGKNRLRTMQVSGTTNQRVHTFISQSDTKVVDWTKEGVVNANGYLEIGVLDLRPVLVADGKYISVELRLSVGQTSDLPNVAVQGKPHKFEDRLLTRLATSFLIPNGGGVLFSLPRKNYSKGPSQLCLLRASSSPKGPVPARTILTSKDTIVDANVLRRLERLPRLDLDMTEVSIDDFVGWFRSSSGLNVILDPNVDRDKSVTIRVKRLRPVDVLKLVLEPRGLTFTARDEALYFTSAENRRKWVQVAIFDVRDVTFGLTDFPPRNEDGDTQQFTGDNLAEFIQNNVARHSWDEGDGASVQFHSGNLVIRNTPEIIRACDRFIQKMQLARHQVVQIRMDTLEIAASSADPILGKAGKESFLIDADQYKRLVQAADDVQRLGWHCYESQRTTLSWDRFITYLSDYKDKDVPVPELFQAKSLLDVRAVPNANGEAVVINLNFRDHYVRQIKSIPIANRLSVQAIVSHSGSLKTTLVIPRGKLAVFKWSLTTIRDAKPRYRIVVLKPALWKAK